MKIINTGFEELNKNIIVLSVPTFNFTQTFISLLIKNLNYLFSLFKNILRQHKYLM